MSSTPVFTPRAIRNDAIDKFAGVLRAAGKVYGWSIDTDDMTVEFFIPELEPVAGFPATIDGYSVQLRPTSRPDPAAA